MTETEHKIEEENVWVHYTLPSGSRTVQGPLSMYDAESVRDYRRAKRGMTRSRTYKEAHERNLRVKLSLRNRALTRFKALDIPPPTPSTYQLRVALDLREIDEPCT